MKLESSFDLREPAALNVKLFLFPHGSWLEWRTPFYRDWARVYLIVDIFWRRFEVCWKRGRLCK